MKAYWENGICYLGDRPTSETSIWAALKAEYIKMIKESR